MNVAPRQPASDLLVARDDLSRTRRIETAVPGAGTGQVVLRVDRLGLTANNVTYAVLGDALCYSEFFPEFFAA